MATQYVDLDMSDTVDVTTTLGLVEGGTYLFQPQGGAVYLREGRLAGLDLAVEGAHIIAPLQTWTVVQALEPFLAWGEGRMVVTEAA